MLEYRRVFTYGDQGIQTVNHSEISMQEPLMTDDGMRITAEGVETAVRQLLLTTPDAGAMRRALVLLHSHVPAGVHWGPNDPTVHFDTNGSRSAGFVLIKNGDEQNAIVISVEVAAKDVATHAHR